MERATETSNARRWSRGKVLPGGRLECIDNLQAMECNATHRGDHEIGCLVECLFLDGALGLNKEGTALLHRLSRVPDFTS